jgi:hypothetical protein
MVAARGPESGEKVFLKFHPKNVFSDTHCKIPHGGWQLSHEKLQPLIFSDSDLKSWFEMAESLFYESGSEKTETWEETEISFPINSSSNPLNRLTRQVDR